MENVQHINSRKIACDGTHNDKGIGHPVVYLHIDEGKKQVVCDYCNTVYIYIEE